MLLIILCTYNLTMCCFLCYSQVPLSVPSQPSSPESKHQTTGLNTGFAAMTIAATTQAELTFQHLASNLGAGAASTTITPAPVTIVRSSPVPPDLSKVPQQPSVPSSTTSGLGTHPLVGMTTEMYQQTSSGLPTAPPTNFPIPVMPPTISLGPTPSLQLGTSHTPPALHNSELVLFSNSPVCSSYNITCGI